MTLSDLLVNLRLDTSSFASGLATSYANVKEYTTNLKSAFAEAGSQIQAQQSNLLAGGAVLTGAITAPLAALASTAMSSASMMAGAEIGFTSMLGSGEKAKVFLEELKAFAAQTPFEFTDLVTGARRLMALGFSASEVIPTMTALGNAAAGLGGGAALIDRIGLALGQMGMKGKVTGEEMRQLVEAGIDGWGMLASATGKSVSEIQELSSKGMIKATEAIPVLIQGMNDKFGNQMEQFSKTTMGKWSNIKDDIGFTITDIGKSLMPMVSMILDNFVIPLTQGLKAIAEGFAGLPTPVQALIVGVAAIAAAIGPVLVALGGLSFSITSIGALIGTTGLTATLGALLPIFGWVAVAVAAVWAAWQLWQLGPVQEAVQSIWNAISGFWNETLKPFALAVWDMAGAFANWGAGVLSSGITTVWGLITSGIDALKSVGESLWNNVLVPIKDAFAGIYEKLQPILTPLADLGAALLYLVGLSIVTYLTAWWEAAKLVWDVIVSVATAVSDFTSLALAPLQGVLETVAGFLSGAFHSAISGIGSFFNTVLVPAFDAAVSGIASFLEWILKIPGVQAVVDAAKEKFGSLGDKVSAAGQAVKDSAAHYNTAAASITGATTAAGKDEAAQKGLKEETDKGSKATLTFSNAKADAKAKMDAAKKSAQELKSAYASLGLKDLKGEVDKLENSIDLLKKTGDWNKLSVDQQKAAVDKLKEAKFQAGQVTYDFTGKLLALTTQLKSTITESGFLFDAMEDIGTSLGDLSTDITSLPMGMLNTDLMTQATNLGAATSQVGFLKEAYTTLGITSKADLEKVATEAAKARDAVLGSNEATDFEKKTAVYIALQAQITAAQKAGIDVPAEQLKMCAKMKSDLDSESGLGGVKTKWSEFATAVSTVITNFAQDAAKALWEGGTSWGDKGKALLTSLGEAVTATFLTPAMTAITGFITNTLEGALKGALEAVGGWFSALGAKIASVFGMDFAASTLGKSLGGVAGGAASAGMGDLTEWAIGTGELGTALGGAGTAAGGAGSAASAGVSGAMGMVGAVSSAVSAVSDVIGNFQFMAMNKSLDLIENSTRYTKIYLGDLLPKLVNDLATGIPLIHQYMIGDMQGVLTRQLTELETIKTSTGVIEGLMNMRKSEPTTINVYVETNASPEAIAAAVASALSLQGAG